MKIIVPEYKNPKMRKAMGRCEEISFLKANDLGVACEALRNGEGDALVAGIDITTRDMVLTCKDKLEKTHKYFSSCFVMKRQNETYVLADAGVCKNPSSEMLKDIVLETYETAKAVLSEEPRIAMLSFSSFGSGGEDSSIDRIRDVIKAIKTECPEIIIEGEMQLDVAICPDVAKKKAGETKVAGRANVLICPDLNSGNILYKSMERFGGFTAAGPILQGFNGIISDLSRGSTVEDIVLVFKTLEKIFTYHTERNGVS